MAIFRHRAAATPDNTVATNVEPKQNQQGNNGDQHLPRYNHNGHKVTKGIHPDGESGRKGIHPWQFLKICFRSSSTTSKFVNILWPFVPTAIAMHFARAEAFEWIFALNYIAIIPAANLIGFAGQELARKLPKVFGTNTCGIVRDIANAFQA